MRTQKTTRGFIVTIVNYDDYQRLDNYKKDTEKDSQGNSERQRKDTINKQEGKEGKEYTLRNIFPHARKGKKGDTLKYLEQVDQADAETAINILKREVKTGAQDPKFIPAMERRARDFVPLNNEVIDSKLLSIYKRIRAGENKIEDTKQFALDFGQDKMLELYDKIQKENKKLLLSGLK